MKHVFISLLLFATAFLPAAIASESKDQPRAENEDYWCTFFDAVGEPIPQAKVQIFRKNKQGREVLVEETSLDERGNLKKRPSNADQCSFIVQHPDYGIARASRYYVGQGIDNFVYSVALVRKGTWADERSIWGVVLDLDNNPVAGAKITCRVAYAAGGVAISGIGSHTVITDQNGRFRMHLPIEPSAGAYCIPPRSKYQVSVYPPKGLGLIPYTGRIPNGQDSKIILERAEHFRTFVFEDANGPITNSEKLKAIYIRVRLANGTSRRFGYTDWKDGTILPLGTFKAGMYSTRPLPFHKYEFEPIKVAAESPEQLVFKVKQKPVEAQKDITYRGQVVSGVGGEPMEGAFVIAGNSSNYDFSLINSGQWQRLHELPSNPSPDNLGLKPVQQIRPFRHITRTDKDGEFEMTINTSEPFEYIIVFEQDYLAVEYLTERKRIFTPDENNIVQIPTTKLFPAATVVLEPVADQPPGVPVKIWARRKFPKYDDLAWFEDFYNYYNGPGQFVMRSYFLPNREGRMHLPAGLKMRIEFTLRIHDRSNERVWCPLLTDVIKARQGQTVDLGQIVFIQKMAIFVQIVDAAGNPLEGVPVRNLPEGEFWVTHITDPEGIAEFHVRPYSKGKFVVGFRADDKEAQRPTEGL